MHWTAVHAAGAHSRAQNEVPTLATRATARARLLICRGIVHVHDIRVAGAGAVRGAVPLPSHRHSLPCSHIGRADALRPQARPGLHGSPLVIPIQHTYTSRAVLPGIACTVLMLQPSTACHLNKHFEWAQLYGVRCRVVVRNVGHVRLYVDSLAVDAGSQCQIMAPSPELILGSPSATR